MLSNRFVNLLVTRSRSLTALQKWPAPLSVNGARFYATQKEKRVDSDKALELKNLKFRPLYLDAQATTALDPRVLDAMMPYMTNLYGNPHSRTHAYGWESELAVETAREVSVMDEDWDWSRFDWSRFLSFSWF